MSRAPPQDGLDRKVRTMQQVIAQNVCPKSGRIFVCGLALDFCVHDTCVNARALGIPRVHLVVDAARAAHVPGVGQFGSGFLTDPAKVRGSIIANGVDVVRAADLLPEGTLLCAASEAARPAVGAQATLSFPHVLGPLGLAPAPRLKIKVTLPDATGDGNVESLAGRYSL